MSGRPDSAGSFAAVMMVYIVIAVGRIEDIVPGLAVIPVAKVAAAVAIVMALRSRTTLAPTSVWSLPPARFTFLVMILIAVSISFSVLKSGTLGVITGTAVATSVGVVLMIKAARNWRAIRLMLLGCVFSAMVLAFSVEFTRFAGRAGYTRGMDPNDFAFVLDGVLPIVVAFALVSRGSMRLRFAGVAIWVVLEILRTESRGGLLGLLGAIAVMVVLLPSSRQGRLAARASPAAIGARVLALAICSSVVWHAIPDTARARLSTITSVHSDYNENLDDPTGRFAIWTQTLPLALRRPWGWGAGTFGTVDGRFGGGRYMQPHNMYLQSLIELGVPGLILFLAAIVSGVRCLMREGLARPEPADDDGLERRAFARGLVASLVGISLAGFFLSELYFQAVWILIAFAGLVGRQAAISGGSLPLVKTAGATRKERALPARARPANRAEDRRPT